HDHTVPAEATHEVDLAISGMTCASCSARVEKKLNRLDGVEASVNLATEKAKVRFAGPVTVEEIMAAVETTGYGATVIGDRSHGDQHDAGHRDEHGEHDHMEDVAPEAHIRPKPVGRQSEPEGLAVAE